VLDISHPGHLAQTLHDRIVVHDDGGFLAIDVGNESMQGCRKIEGSRIAPCAATAGKVAWGMAFSSYGAKSNPARPDWLHRRRWWRRTKLHRGRNRDARLEPTN
jgi:hypothetical protein